MSKNVLILGGTGEASALAHALADKHPELYVTIALAGETRDPSTMPGHMRVGNFGGAEGLSKFLIRRGMNMVIDATHPFAAQISQNAVEACHASNVPRLRFDRPQWVLPHNTDIIFVPDAHEAARLVARTSKSAFLTSGRKTLSAFEGVRDVKLLVRMIEESEPPLSLENLSVVYASAPFVEADEINLMRDHQIDTLVSKASGGDATRAKIDAAAAIGVRIILIRRPPPPDGDRASQINDVLAWIEKHTLK